MYGASTANERDDDALTIAVSFELYWLPFFIVASSSLLSLSMPPYHRQAIATRVVVQEAIKCFTNDDELAARKLAIKSIEVSTIISFSLDKKFVTLWSSSSSMAK